MKLNFSKLRTDELAEEHVRLRSSNSGPKFVNGNLNKRIQLCKYTDAEAC